MYKNYHFKAFSIVELSIIITIISTIAIGFLVIGNAQMVDDAVKIENTYNKMLVIDNAIKNFVAQFGRLPCPALSTIPFGNVVSVTYNTLTYSFAYDDEYMANTINSSYANGAECISEEGAVPTKALNLPASYMLDEWGRKISFFVDYYLCGNNSRVNSVCTPLSYSSSGRYTLNDFGTEFNPNYLAYVLVSSGPDGYGAYPKSGQFTSINNAGTTNEESNSATRSLNTSPFQKGPTTSRFDDIVIYATKSQIAAAFNMPGRPVVAVSDCVANSNVLASFTIPNLDNIKDVLFPTQSCNGSCGGSPYYLGNYNTGDQAVLNMMWVLQEACYALYSTAITKQCPTSFVLNSNNYSCSYF